MVPMEGRPEDLRGARHFWKVLPMMWGERGVLTLFPYTLSCHFPKNWVHCAARGGTAMHHALVGWVGLGKAGGNLSLLKNWNPGQRREQQTASEGMQMEWRRFHFNLLHLAGHINVICWSARRESQPSLFLSNLSIFRTCHANATYFCVAYNLNYEVVLDGSGKGEKSQNVNCRSSNHHVTRATLKL